MKRPAVAIVDDDPGFSGYLRTFLELRGYDPRCYSRGDELIAHVRTNDLPDVVLLDVMMPGMDGIDTLRALKAQHPEVQAIMLSGREQASTIVEAVRLGAVDYVVKPDEPEGLGEIALDVAIKNAVEKRRLVSEIGLLRQQLTDKDQTIFWGSSDRMRLLATLVEQVADSDVTVLIRGESGTGKELVARALHNRSPRRSRPFVKVNCAALPAELLESELFGHERGAFTGAMTTRVGKFEQAHGGTLMLDEIGEMKAALQAKLLHVLQDGEFCRLGSNQRRVADVRIIAATNRDLDAMMMRGEFREDLYYRLKVIEMFVPPLRERRDEIEPLAEFFMDKYARKYNRPLRALSPELREALLEHPWPGNVRELENLIKRLVILQDEELAIRELRVRRVPPPVAAQPPVTPFASMAGAVSVPTNGRDGHGGVATERRASAGASSAAATLDPEEADAPGPDNAAGNGGIGTVNLMEVGRQAAQRAERRAIEETLTKVRWNRRKAAVILGVSYKTLLNKIRECGIEQQ